MFYLYYITKHAFLLFGWYLWFRRCWVAVGVGSHSIWLLSVNGSPAQYMLGQYSLVLNKSGDPNKRVWREDGNFYRLFLVRYTNRCDIFILRKSFKYLDHFKLWSTCLFEPNWRLFEAMWSYYLIYVPWIPDSFPQMGCKQMFRHSVTR